MEIEIVTPSRKVLSQSCDEVYLPGPRGEFGILPEHVAFVSTLSTGITKITNGGSTQELAIHRGFVQVLENKISVLAQECLFPSEINRVEVEKERIEIERKMIAPEVGVEERDQVIEDRNWVSAKASIM